ncbi:hypothetical protein Poli38472_010327 [Pythium oligandrum]|uniref:Uncharacterized protein n=1 Tax=Pythium oligandrum TaxID=41045 RepID=A0A8K1C2X4_PYTOL|nr:hypothetical protein Poli38472_010327 [Pythium oligandrum]|eukprot:TMW55445.1 hypothetical protein Poli38472_010327 [Pythium oligandrum]
MVSGSLTLKIHGVEGAKHAHKNEEGHHTAIRIKVAGQEKRTKFKGSEDAIDQTLHFELKDVDENTPIQWEVVLENNQKEPIASAQVPLAPVISEEFGNPKTIDLTKNVKISVDVNWTLKGSKQKYLGTKNAEVAETAAAVLTMNPSRALTVHETHRPWFMRASYYYDTTKNVYNYTTSFRVVSSIARFGENTTNAVLEKITGKKLTDLDQQLVAPTLSTLDNKVDEAISLTLVKLIEGQNYVIKQKNVVVDTASSVAKKSTEQVSSIVGATLNTATKAKDYTTTQIKSVTSSAYTTVASATEYTTKTVVSASSSTLNTVRGATVYVVSHVPVLGAKIRS